MFASTFFCRFCYRSNKCEGKICVSKPQGPFVGPKFLLTYFACVCEYSAVLSSVHGSVGIHLKGTTLMFSSISGGSDDWYYSSKEMRQSGESKQVSQQNAEVICY